MNIFEVRNSREFLFSLLLGLNHKCNFKILNLSGVEFDADLLKSFKGMVGICNIKYRTFFDKLRYNLFNSNVDILCNNSVDSIFVFHESSPFIVSSYKYKVDCHLIEHGLINYEENEEIIRRMSCSSKLLCNIFRKGKTSGRSPNVKSIYLLHPEYAPLDIRKKCVKFNLRHLWKKLPNEVQSNILATFDFDDVQLKDKYSLLLTQPIEVYSELSEADKVTIYKKVLDNYANGEILIKPHPLETTPYELFFPTATVSRGTYPVELLAIIKNNPPDTVLTLFSTAAFAFEGESRVLWLSNIGNEKLIKAFGECKKPFDRYSNGK